MINADPEWKANLGKNYGIGGTLDRHGNTVAVAYDIFYIGMWGYRNVLEEMGRSEADVRALGTMDELADFAEQLKAEAKKQADNLKAEARKQADQLLEEAKGDPLKEFAAKAAADALIKEADKRIDGLLKDANKKADQLLADANKQADEIMKEAEERAKLSR